MNSEIWKFKIGDIYTAMPRGAKILSVGVQNEAVYIWALVDPEEIPVSRKIEVHATGQFVRDAESLKFIGTVMLSGGDLVYHVFERNLSR